MPPLRRRKEDLESLVPQFVAEYNHKAGKRVSIIPAPVWQRLMKHQWLGNIRELRNVVERCVLFADNEVFPVQWLQLGEPTESAPVPAKAAEARVEGDQLCIPLDGSMALEDMDRFIIKTALEMHDYNVTATARALGSTRETLRYRIQKYGLSSGSTP